MNIKYHIQMQRIENGWTQKELGEKLDLASNTISQYESGIREPDLETLYKMMQLFKVDANYFFDIKNEEPKEITSNKIEILERQVKTCIDYNMILSQMYQKEIL